MTTISLPLSSVQIDSQIAAAVSEGLLSRPKWLPSWLFYDAAGSRLFDQVTELPEYYVTRTERAILADRAEEIVRRAAGERAARGGDTLRIVELGAGSCDKTRLLLRAAVDRQDILVYEPVDVSASALTEAQERIEDEIPGVLVCPRVVDYTRDFSLEPPCPGERRLVLYIGSSIGNFEPDEAQRLLESVRAALFPGDALLLGVDMVKDRDTLLRAYDDAAGVTAAFNRNILARINRELGADFDQEAFQHRAVWNRWRSRIEMHLSNLLPQTVKIPALDLCLEFEVGETIHTENSYKYKPGQAEAMLREAGFAAEETWNDEKGWFSVCLARAE
jgi:L-histidine N-alpha-methyltransferase